MADNATTTWRWNGRTSPVWGGANWLDLNGVAVDDWPAGSLPTHTVKALLADLAGTTVGVGPTTALTIGTLIHQIGDTAVFANMTVASANIAGDGRMTGGVVSALTLEGTASARAGTVNVAHLYEGAYVGDAAGGGTVIVQEAHFHENSSINGATVVNAYFDAGTLIEGGTISNRMDILGSPSSVWEPISPLVLSGCVIYAYANLTIEDTGANGITTDANTIIYKCRPGITVTQTGVAIPVRYIGQFAPTHSPIEESGVEQPE